MPFVIPSDEQCPRVPLVSNIKPSVEVWGTALNSIYQTVSNALAQIIPQRPETVPGVPTKKKQKQKQIQDEI